MKKSFFALCLLAVLLCSLALTGCADEKAENRNESIPHNEEVQNESVEKAPDKLKKVLDKNIFKGITAFEGRLLKAEICTADEESKTVTQKVQMLDIYGNELAAYTVSSDDAYSIATLTATKDGGFLFVLGFEDYAYGESVWASDKGFASRVIKCDKNGKLQFDTALDGVEGDALDFCFEKDGRLYFFGTIQASETKTQGVYSGTDIYMTVLDENGAVLKNKCIAGSDYDSLSAAECAENGFMLSISSQSEDGAFAGSNSNGYPVDWVITVNYELEITEKKKESGRDYFDTKLGEKDGKPVYKSDNLLKSFDAGTPTAFIDYGGFYLVVSENITGEYEKTPPMLSSIWYYTETVYSGYDGNGSLIFRTSVDSSPDYDACLEKLHNSLGTVQILEIASDTDESSYRVGVALPATDFSSVGQVLADKITKEWEVYDSMTEMQVLLSSKLWGVVGIQTDTWNECEQAVGFTLNNPLESVDWLCKTGYFGKESADPNTPIKHVKVTATSQTADRKVSGINITAGYCIENIQVTLRATLSSNDGMYTLGSVCNGYATYEQNTATTRTGISVLIVTANEANNKGYYNGDYYAPTAYWVKDNVFYTLSVFGDETDRADIQTVLVRILAEF